MVELLLSELIKKGYDFYTGVPCSLLISFFNYIYANPSKLTYVSGLREDTAVGISAGAYLAGKKPAILMQNSGFGSSINAITSLLLPYDIPVFFIIGYRGYQGKDTEENKGMGALTEKLLADLDIPYLFLQKSSVNEIMDFLIVNSSKSRALLITE
ncbi:MAG: thiamine pyrophosphate-binding protein [bacterium]